jgi:SAM-dependent methyltransferase
MRIEKNTNLYEQLYNTLAQRPGLKSVKPHSIHRYLEMKQIDWQLWDKLSGLVLDVGCHIPLDAVILSRMPLVKRTIIIDLRVPPKRLVPRKSSFVQCDATRLAFPDESFEVVMSFSAIEHLPNRDLQRLWVSEMVRVVKPGGQLLVTVDNAWSWLNRIWDRYRPPMRRLRASELRNWAMGAGDLKVEAKTSGALYYWGFRPPFRGSAHIAYRLDRLLNPLSSWFPWFGNRIGYRFRKLA